MIIKLIKKHKFLLAVVATLLLFLLLNFGYFVATNWRNFLPKKVIPLAPKPELKVYDNQKLGFELKYPPDWSLTENETGVEINPPAKENPYNRVYFTFYSRSEFSSLDEVKEKLANSIPLTPVELKESVGFKYMDGGTHEVIWFKNANSIYVVRKFATSNEADKIFESINFIKEDS